MLVGKFDPYGEALPDDGPRKTYITKVTAAFLSRAGQLVFWMLVIVIVGVRVRYFSAGL